MKQTLGTQTTAWPPEFINNRLLNATLDLCGRAKVVSFVVAYALTETANVGRKTSFCTALDNTVQVVPSHEQSSIVMDTNARTGKRGGGGVGSKDTKY